MEHCHYITCYSKHQKRGKLIVLIINQDSPHSMGLKVTCLTIETNVKTTNNVFVTVMSC